MIAGARRTGAAGGRLTSCARMAARTKTTAGKNRKPLPQAADLGARARLANNWRDSFNPLRTLTIARVVTLHEAYDRGDMADVQWTFRAVERMFGVLSALIARRTSALLEMDWDVRLVAKTRTGFDEALAREQAAVLREHYERIGNLYELIEHLALAEFRGYAIAGRPDFSQPGPVRVEIVDPWNVVRDGTAGGWKYNPGAQSVGYKSLPEEMVLPPESIIQMVTPRPINFFALPLKARTALAEKDWTAFLEIYGVPQGVVIMPQEVPEAQETTFADAAEKIAGGQPGALPYGSDYRPNDSPRGVNPFRDFLNYFAEQVVLVGTGGRLTMLTEAGSGTLAGGAHSDTFRQIARGHARRISEAMQRQVDADILAAAFPGRPAQAYWQLDFLTDPASVIDDALKLSQAGYQIAPEELSEKTGYTLRLASAAGVPTATSGPGLLAELGAIRNRLGAIKAGVRAA